MLEKIRKWISRRRISYYPGIGYMYRIPHFDAKGKDISKELLQTWLDEKVAKGEHFSIQQITDDEA